MYRHFLDDMDFDEEEEESEEIEKELEEEVEELKKNSIISVTVDDLNEGLIVVSYSHQDNLYQGVLLQLNRERGIPSGISFPKDTCTGSILPTDEGENDPTQVKPMNQRHTYFQNNPHPEHIGVGAKSRLGLRRIIKPPARFKNSRMSLRLKTRPVLCAKCKTLCEDKSAENPIEPEKKSKNSLKRNGTSIRKEEVPCIEVSTRTVSTETEPYIPFNDEDFSYETIGNKGIVENYWRRPLTRFNGKTKPISQNLLDSQFGEPNPGLKTALSLSVPIPQNVYPKSFPYNEHGNDFLLQEVPESSPPPNTLTESVGRKNRKNRSLKACINKLTANQESYIFENEDNSTANNIRFDRDLTSSAERGFEEEYDDKILFDGVEHIGGQNFHNRRPPRLPRRHKNTESRSQSKKRSSTVPVRFRDDSYLTRKNVFSFKRRDGTDEASEVSELGHAESSIEIPPEIQSESHEETNNTFEKVERSSSELSRSPVSSNSTSSIVSPPSNGHLSISDTKREPIIGGKIPKLKITFGPPGNGIIVIPPKEYSPPETSGSDPESKALRRALRKAKKEARRKISYPSPLLVNTQVQSPSPPTLKPISPLILDGIQDEGRHRENFEFMKREDSGTPVSPFEEFFTPPKRRKKEKKRRRSKTDKHESSSKSKNVDTLLN